MDKLEVKHGDYVLATKWFDGDPGDAWAVGYYDREQNGRHYVTYGKGDDRQIRHNGYRSVARISEEVGKWLINDVAPSLEKSPPGTVNLWAMLTNKAYMVDDDA